MCLPEDVSWERANDPYNSHSGVGGYQQGEVEVTLRPQANQQLRRLCPGHTLIFSKCHQRCSRPQLRALQKGRLLGEVSPSCKWSHSGGKGGGVAQKPYSPPRPFLPAFNPSHLNFSSPLPTSSLPGLQRAARGLGVSHAVGNGKPQQFSENSSPHEPGPVTRPGRRLPQ